jgi:hypothetical protein
MQSEGIRYRYTILECEPICNALTQEAFDAEVNANAGKVLLAYPHIVARMSDEQFDEACIDARHAALSKKEIVEKMNETLFIQLTNKYKTDAILFQHVCDRLTRQHFNEIVKQEPMAALSSVAAVNKMMDTQFYNAIKALGGDKTLVITFVAACDRLTNREFNQYLQAEPWIASLKLSTGELKYPHVSRRIDSIAANIIKEEEKMKINTPTKASKKLMDSEVSFLPENYSMKFSEAVQLLEIQNLSTQYQRALSKLSKKALTALSHACACSSSYDSGGTDIDEAIDLIRDKMTEEQKTTFDLIENQFNALHSLTEDNQPEIDAPKVGKL